MEESNPSLPSGVIFDMDGLLFDSEAVYRDVFLEAAGTMGYAFSVHFFQLVGNSWTANRRILHEQLGSTGNSDAFRTAWIRCLERTAGTVALKAGVIELVDHLDRLELPRAICTSSGHEDVQSNLAAHNLGQRFEAVVASGDYTRGKSFPDPYLKAAEQRDVAPRDCLALEGSHNGVRSAATAGMCTVMVPDLLPATEEILALCQCVANDLHTVSSYTAHLK